MLRPMNHDVKTQINMSADEVLALLEQAMHDEPEKAVEAHKKLHDLRHELNLSPDERLAIQ